MTEKSLFWTTNDTGDGPLAGYTMADFYNFLRRLLIPDSEASQGILRGVGGELAVSGSASPLSIAAGAAIVYGLFYENSAALNLAVSTPITGTTGGRVNLKADWTAQTVRAVVQMNTDGVASIPSLTQVAGSEWSIPLASFTITTAGAITLTDARVFCQFASVFEAGMIDALDGLSVVGRASSTAGAAAAIIAGSDGQVLRRSGSSIGFGQVATAGIADDAITVDKIANDAIDTDQIADAAVTTDKIAADSVDDTKAGNRVPQFYRRQGGSATDWDSQGTTTYTPGAVRMQGGTVNVSISDGQAYGEVTVTFPQAYSYKPIVLAGVYTGSTPFYATLVDAIGTTTFKIRLIRTTTSGNVTVAMQWFSIGPE